MSAYDYKQNKKVIIPEAYANRLTPLRYHPVQQEIIDDTMRMRYRFTITHAGRRCLAEGTRIYMVDGTVKRIEDVVPGDMVWSLNLETNILEPKKVVEVYDNGIQECVGMETSSGKHIRCTETHRFLRNKKWIETKNLFHGEFIATVEKKKVVKEMITFFCSAGRKQTYDISVEDNHNFVANGIITHNSGKSEIVGKRRFVYRAAAGVPCPNPKYFVAAPTRDQVWRLYWNDLKTMTLPFRDPNKPPSESKLIIYLRGNIEIHLLGMDKPERIEGSHWDGGVLDEFANMKKTTWEAHVRPALSTPGRPLAWCDFVGVPEGRNHFYDLTQRAKAIEVDEGKRSDWKTYHWVSSDIVAPEEIAKAKSEMDELVFRQEYEGSFENFSGRAYYNFNSDIHCAKLHYDPRKDLIFCFDFNVDPGVAAVVQEQWFVDPKTQIPIINSPCTGIIGEVYIPKNSNTIAVCNKLVEDWGSHQGRVLLYGDPSGGHRATSQIRGTDWDLVKEVLLPVYGDRLVSKVLRRQPSMRARTNAVNSRLMNTLGQARMQVDPRRAPHVVIDFEGVTLLEGGSGELDKKSNLELTHMCFGKETIVETDKGGVQIGRLPKSGKIKTAFGFKNYVDAGCRGYKKVIQLKFNNGETIVCTEDHLFLTMKGWVKACDLSGTMLYNSQINHKEVIIWNQLELFQQKFKSFVVKVINTQVDILKGGIIGFTELFGSIIKALFGKVILFTTLMEMFSIIRSKILNYFRNQTICPYICRTQKEKKNQGRVFLNMLCLHLLNGIGQKKVENGIVRIQKNKIIQKGLQKFAQLVGKNIESLCEEKAQDTALIDAGPLQVEQTKKIMDRKEFAKIVERFSKSTNIEREFKNIAIENVMMKVEEIIDCGYQEVFCPTVEGGHFILFDQIVVSNSDSIAYYTEREFPVENRANSIQSIGGF